MLTIFTVPKAFEGHIGMIQRNAIRSWKRLRPECQVIICGDEVGSRETVAKFQIDQIVEIARNEFGTPLLSSVFQLAEEQAAYDLLCYINADIILFSDLLDAVRQVSEANRRFLMVGQAWNLDVTEEFAAEDGDWEIDLRQLVAQAGTVRLRNWIDYFVYPRDTIGPLPAFAVGRPSWDNWMIYRARSRRVPVVDVSASTLVIHQNHRYGHVKQVRGDQYEGPEGDSNLALLGFPKRSSFSLDDATHRLTPTGLVRAPSADFKSRIRTELLLSPAIVPAYRALRPAYRRLRSLRRAFARR